MGHERCKEEEEEEKATGKTRKRGARVFYDVEFSGAGNEAADEAHAEAQARPLAQKHHSEEQVEREFCALFPYIEPHESTAV